MTNGNLILSGPLQLYSSPCLHAGAIIIVPESASSRAAGRGRSCVDTGMRPGGVLSQHRVGTVSAGGDTPSGTRGPEQGSLWI